MRHKAYVPDQELENLARAQREHDRKLAKGGSGGRSAVRPSADVEARTREEAEDRRRQVTAAELAAQVAADFRVDAGERASLLKLASGAREAVKAEAERLRAEARGGRLSRFAAAVQALELCMAEAAAPTGGTAEDADEWGAALRAAVEDD